MFQQYSDEFLILVMYLCFRQTSDPRSGFGTVEMDLLGGLTLMLGDRKVSQLLHLNLIYLDTHVESFLSFFLDVSPML